MNAHDYTGCTFIDLAKYAKVFPDMSSSSCSPPTWFPLMYQHEGDSCGEILISVELFRKEKEDSILPRVPSIIPEMRTAYLEIIILGLRDLEPYQCLPINSVRV